jgi:ankyrin repeat protein
LDSNGYTPLELAIQNSDLDTMEFLLEHDAQIPNDIVVSVIEYLLKKGAQIGTSKDLVRDILSHEVHGNYELNGIYLEDNNYDHF